MATPAEAPNRIPAHVLTAQLEGEAVLLDLQTKRYFRLNATAARVWNGLEHLLTLQQIVEALVQEFEVNRAEAQAETDRVLEDFRARGLIT
jgi:hypothetical protein